MAREGLQFTQDRLKAGSWDLSETSKSSSVSANAAGFCACEARGDAWPWIAVTGSIVIGGEALLLLLLLHRCKKREEDD